MLEQVRSYEISVWTLQDSFIAVLKPSEHSWRGSIKEPKLTLKDDNENSLSFKIPMYLLDDKTAQFVENPIWENVRNGNVIANLRKLKVIFNKATDDEKVFEFIITKVTEEHDGFSKYCSVDCSGLAFHELGKQGYGISFSFDEFEAEYEEWKKNGSAKKEPYANINYWIEKVLENTYWDYIVCMDWAAQDGIIVDNEDYLNKPKNERDEYNDDREARGLRRKDMIYNDSYVSSWDTEDDKLVAREIAEEQERIEYPEANESNRYNILQDIAEKFQVYCKFQYDYDDNYHIIGRKVIFYNNFLSEAEGMLDFTYGYNTKHISREMDSTDTITKMYIKPLSDSGVLNGSIYLQDSPANKSMENYLMNFDYMYNIGTITKEQYEYIDELYAKLHDLNKEMIEKSTQLGLYELQLPELEAKQKTAEDMIEEAKKRLTDAGKELQELTGSNEVCQRTKTSPQQLALIHGRRKDKDYYYCNIKEKGVKDGTIHLYKNWTSASGVTDEINKNTWSLKADESGNINEITFGSTNPLAGNENTYLIYAVYDFYPQLPVKQIQQQYNSVQKKNEDDLDIITGKINNINEEKKVLEKDIEDRKEEKETLLARFERFMGPALREGYWQPEDTYSKYSTIKNCAISGGILTKKGFNTATGEAVFGWDADRFDEEVNFYYYGIEMKKVYYPCIDISNFTKITSDNIDSLAYVYQDPAHKAMAKPEEEDTPYVYRYLHQNAENGFKFVFLRKGDEETGTVIPAIMLLGAESLVEYENYTPYDQLMCEARLSIIKGFDETGEKIVEEIIVDKNTLKAGMIKENQISNYTVVYPRFCINSNMFITTYPENLISRTNSTTNKVDLLKDNEDYYTLFDQNKWYVTIKPESIIANKCYTSNYTYTLNYAISTAADAVYLDAVEVMKENSQPKVSYTVEPLPTDRSFIYNAYNRLGQLAHINDIELKFEDVRGYISEMELDLDKPWEDSYIIKNYKTKFEDLFSSIVAQTSAMQKNSAIIGMTANMITPTGAIVQEKFNQSLVRSNLVSQVETFAVKKTFASITEGNINVSSTYVDKIINGQIGLNFSHSDTIETALLNTTVGLLIGGRDDREIYKWFQVTNKKMGFFHIEYDANTGEEKEVPDLSYESGNLTLSGAIKAKSGNIGGWEIGEKLLHVGEGSNYAGISSESYSFWAGNETASSAPFSVTKAGAITATSGAIGGWNINSSNGLYYGNSTPGTNGSLILSPKGATTTNVIAGSSGSNTWMISAGAKFGVTTSGILYATEANLSGAVTATTLKVGSGNNLLTYDASHGLVVKGDITATSGAITGGLTVSGYLTTNSSRTKYDTSLDGITIDKNGIGGWGSATSYFTLTTGGKLTAVNADISGTINVGGKENSDSKILIRSENNLLAGKINEEGLLFYGGYTEDGKTCYRAIKFINGDNDENHFFQISALLNGTTNEDSEVRLWADGSLDLQSDTGSLYLGSYLTEKNKAQYSSSIYLTEQMIRINFHTEPLASSSIVESTSQLDLTANGIVDLASWKALGIKVLEVRPDTTSNGNFGIGLSSSKYRVLAAFNNNDEGSYIVTPYVSGGGNWYLHITDATGAVIAKKSFFATNSFIVLYIQYA